MLGYAGPLMRQAPRKLSSDEALYTAALRAHMRRAHSTFEMRLYLERRAEEPAAAKRILARLKHEKMIDDERYALEFARARAALDHRQSSGAIGPIPWP